MTKIFHLNTLLNFGLISVAFFFYNSFFFNFFGSTKLQQSSNSVKTQIKITLTSPNAPIFNSDGKKRIDPNLLHICALILPLKHQGRLILMVIDAMRYDFIWDDHNHNQHRMPYLHRLIGENRVRPFKLVAKSPTVTLPRLKALLTGLQPQFIDILWNFNTTRLVEDNLLRQFRLANRSIVFYGDDTWLKLFDPPDQFFLRHEGTHSFIASDYDEVEIKSK